AEEFRRRSNVFSESLLAATGDDLAEWSKNVQPGVVFRPDEATARLADRPDVRRAASPQAAIDGIATDLRRFRDAHHLDQVVVVNCASTEPPVELSAPLQSLSVFQSFLGRA